MFWIILNEALELCPELFLDTTMICQGFLIVKDFKKYKREISIKGSFLFIIPPKIAYFAKNIGECYKLQIYVKVKPKQLKA